MINGNLSWIANFIWGIADDVLRDLYVRGKYHDVILPMTVLRRLDALLEPTKQAAKWNCELLRNDNRWKCESDFQSFVNNWDVKQVLAEGLE